MGNNNPTKLLIDASIILAICTTLLYLGDFSYEAGMDYYYKLPPYLIDVNVYSILKFAFLTAPFILMFAGATLTNFIFIKNRFNRKHIMESLFIVILSEIFVLFISFLISYYTSINTVVPISCGLVIITSIIRIILRKRRVIRASQNTEEQSDIYSSELALLIRALTFFFSLLAYVLFCYYSGFFEAKNSKSYFVTGKQNNIIILGKNSDVLNGKVFDLKKLKLSDTIMFFKLGDKDSPVLIKKDIRLVP